LIESIIIERDDRTEPLLLPSSRLPSLMIVIVRSEPPLH